MKSINNFGVWKGKGSLSQSWPESLQRAAGMRYHRRHNALSRLDCSPLAMGEVAVWSPSSEVQLAPRGSCPGPPQEASSLQHLSSVQLFDAWTIGQYTSSMWSSWMNACVPKETQISQWKDPLAHPSRKSTLTLAQTNHQELRLYPQTSVSLG